MGGFHILLNYLTAIGKIMDSSGLKEIVVQAKLLLPGTCEKVFQRKGYYQAINANCILYEVLLAL